MNTVATHLVESVSKLSFSDFLQNHLFQPLSMDSTNLQPERARAKGLGERIATGYFWDNDAGEYREIPCYDCPESQGAAGIISSANDYIKWVNAIMKRQGPITEGVFEGLIKERILQNLSDEDNVEETFYAAGWDIRQYCGHKIVSHNGSEEGFVCNHFFIPNLNFREIIISNSDMASEVVSILTYALIDHAMQVPRPESFLGTRKDLNWNPESETSPDDSDGESMELEEELRQELCPGIKEPELQSMPLSAYTGEYQNPGYRKIKVKEKDGLLFVGASDRSMAFTLTFEHVCEQTKYIAHVRESLYGGDPPIKAEFRLEGNRAVQISLHLEERFEEYIWFNRAKGEAVDSV